MTPLNRKVELEACFNFRDLGGLQSAGGRTIRPGVIYRSDSLQWLTPADGERLGDLGIRTVIDLRSTDEHNEGRHSPNLENAMVHHLPVFENDAPPFTPFRPGDPDPPPGQLYIDLATGCGDAIANALRIISGGELAVVFHCAAGKDRTGVIAALLLSALGVLDRDIVEDYLLTNEALDPSLVWMRINAPAVADTFENLPAWLRRAAPDHMWAFLEYLRDNFGSVDGYLESIGIDKAAVAALQDRYLAA